MALLEEWQKIAYDQQADRGKLQKFWQRYFMLEKGVYEKLLTNPDEKVEGTVKELAEKYDLSIMDMTGFLDGINDSLKVQVNSHGGELWSIQTKDGAEYLWQGDEAYWKDRALNLFPYIARLTEGKYMLDGKTYEMPIHGFVNSSDLEAEEHTAQTGAEADRQREYERNVSLCVCLLADL